MILLSVSGCEPIDHSIADMSLTMKEISLMFTWDHEIKLNKSVLGQSSHRLLVELRHYVDYPPALSIISRAITFFT